MTTVILGGGIIGISTAYYLSRQTSSSSSPEKVIILESSPFLFLSASGYAGGFLAEDWFSPPVASLGALSFKLHRELAQRHAGQEKWGYAGSLVYSLSVDETGVSSKPREEKGNGEDWISDGTSRAQVAPRANNNGKDMVNPDGSPAVWTPQRGGTLEAISSSENCAQIEPRELCDFLLEQCEKSGVEVMTSTRASEVLTDDHGAVKGLKAISSTNGEQQEREVMCNNVVITAGAWTPRVFKTLFPGSKLRIPIEPLAGHSLVVKSPRYTKPFIESTGRGDTEGGQAPQLCYSIYCTPGRHWSYAPEAFARLARNGETEIWVGGLNDSSLELPERAVDVKAMIDADSIENLKSTTVQLTGLAREGDDLNHDDLETLREGLCFRPVSQKGTPLVGRVPDKHLGGVKFDEDGGGVWIASGHGPWGISLSLGTGKVMSEMLTGQKLSANVKSLSIG
jgi:glycine/D-amino acid oxidase-like deaminating enzyme